MACTRVGLLFFSALAGGLLASCDGFDGSPGPRIADPATLKLAAVNTLPPGQSGFVSVPGQAQGTLTMDPGQFGPHLDDQRLMYWNVQHKPGGLRAKCANPAHPKGGVDVCRDEFGVPAIYADTLADLSYGHGYAVAQDRPFLMDALRRTAAGTLAELAGCGSVAADIQTRVLTYSEAEYQHFYDVLPGEFQQAVDGYVAGANAWIAEATTDPNKLPAEYVVLSSQPQPFTRTDVMRAAMLISRTVASEGGNEFSNIRMLKSLESKYGKTQGRAVFNDLVWQEDGKAVTTIPREDGVFPNHPLPAQGRDAVFNQLADWALTLPLTIEKGPGTGHASAPTECALDNAPSLPIDLPVGLGAGKSGATTRLTGQQRKQALAAVRRAAQGVEHFRRSLHGGSFMVAIGPGKTRDGNTLLMSEPQLGYTYPTLLVEVELHGGGFDIRGVSAPLLPLVVIGYTDYVAWALTTGYSKTIDSFIETVCSTAQQGAGTCTANQYFHNGQWRNMSCRNETVNFRTSVNGVPAGPAAFSTVPQVCRTVHGPVVARDDAAGLARSVSYAMWMRELDNFNGVAVLGRAKSFAEIDAGIRTLTLNENVGVATRDGNIAFYHPGLFPRRNANTDQRLPNPGTGEFDFNGSLTPNEMPHVINPKQGFFANWNNKPAYGWLDGEGFGNTSRPGGHATRVSTLIGALAEKSDWTFEDLQTLDGYAGKRDHRATDFLPLLESLRAGRSASLTSTQRAALDLVLAWDGSAFGPDLDITDPAGRDGPAATIFGAFIEALRDALFAELKTVAIDGEVTAFSRMSNTGSHVFDQGVMDNLALRVLDPASSALAVQADYLHGRTRDAVLLEALDAALETLRVQFAQAAPLTPAALTSFRRVHPRSTLDSLTGVIGPSTTMPYLDRGSWVHLVGFVKAQP